MPGKPDCGAEIQIAQLRDLDLDELRLRWRTTFGRTAPAKLPRHFLFRLFAYRLQTEAYGDLSPTTVHLLASVTRAKSGHKKTVARVGEGLPGQLKLGTVLVREHDAVSHHVMVVENGFAWNGNTYSSLSTVARAITGTAWNGPRFFGLRDKAKQSGAKVPT